MHIEFSVSCLKYQEKPLARFRPKHNGDDSGNGSIMRLCPLPQGHLNKRLCSI